MIPSCNSILIIASGKHIADAGDQTLDDNPAFNAILFPSPILYR